MVFRQFLGNSPSWFKLTMIVFLLICYPASLLLHGFEWGHQALGWSFVVMFIFTLAMALKCYPLQSGGLLALAIFALGLTTPELVWIEIGKQLPVILLLVFMVSFIYFMQPLLIFLFGKILIKVKNKIVLSLLFSISAAFLSAFLDALTVTAVLITVFIALYGVYEKVHSNAKITDFDDNEMDDSKQMGGDTLKEFRAFIRSLVMHGAVGTALGGVTTMVGEPQNLLIADEMGWTFGQFAANMSHVTIPAVIAGLLTLVVVEYFKWFGFGTNLDSNVRHILNGYLQKQDEKRTYKEKYALIIQAISAIFLIYALATHVMQPGLIGLSLLVFVTAFTGITKEHQIGKAFEESLPFVSLLVIFFVVVSMIEELHLFKPIIHMVLAMSPEAQPRAFFLANGILSAISDNVFVATIYIKEVKAAFAAGGSTMTQQHLDALAVAINTGTNLPSVATPNGQAAFLFLLTSALAPAIKLGYVRMVFMALPYTIVLTIVGFFAQ
ncbi:MAG TPA: sodium/proton antiporter NhaB [Oceanospirillales bacterium]|nr:sodium/proton antiporter NhaB [Oceanospirillales bacterium]